MKNKARTILIFCAINFFSNWLTFNAYGADEWLDIGTSASGYKVFVTEAEVPTDGVLRMFIKAEKTVEISPDGFLAFFKKSQKITDRIPPFSLLLNCKKRAVRDDVPGPLGSEFHVPWTKVPPGSLGSIALTAFCRK